MNVLNTSAPQRRQQGFVSIMALLFLSSVVVLILMQSVSMSGSKSLEAQSHFDSVAALAVAEGGKEVSLAGLTNTVNADDTAFLSGCATYANSTPVNLGRGSFQYIPSPTTPTGVLCPIRVKGTVGSAQRTLESQINLSSVVGTGGYGTVISMSLNNPYSVAAAAVFNLAWRRLGSTGQSPSGSQADASACTLPSCGLQWNLESSSGTPSVGSLGTSLSVGPNASVPVTQTLSTARNYAEVGVILGGFSSSTPPALKGHYFDSKETTNTKNQDTTTGTTTSGEANAWCNGADTLVFGVSGRGDDNPSAAFSSVKFNTAEAGLTETMQWVSHFPNTTAPYSPNTFGDVFSEIWYIHNPYALLTKADSDKDVSSTIRVASTSGLKVGTKLKIYTLPPGAAGVFNGKTTITAIDANGKDFTVSPAPTTPLKNATICGGICALFQTPSSTTAQTTFSLTRATSAAQQWAGGFACYSGVDPNKVRRVSNSNLRVQQWHEVLSGE